MNPAIEASYTDAPKYPPSALKIPTTTETIKKGMRLDVIKCAVAPGMINMANLIKKYSLCNKTIVTDFQITHRERKDKLAYSVDPSQLNPLLDDYRDTHIIHWTRGCNKAWPDERAIDYYQDIINSTNYPRTAFDTLMRIIKSGRI